MTTKVPHLLLNLISVLIRRCGLSYSQTRAVFARRRLNGFLGLSLNDRTILFQVILLDKTVSVG